MKWIKKTYLQCIPLRFGVCLSFYCFFGFCNHCYSFHRTNWRLVTSIICRGPGPVATRMPFFSPKFKSAANFSAPAWEGNLFFLCGRSARKKIYNFPIKSSHLCQTSRHVWLSSSACDHCCAYQLICIMTISTYSTGARAEMTRQLGSCTVKNRVLACILVATGPGPRQIEVTSLHFVIWKE